MIGKTSVKYGLSIIVLFLVNKAVLILTACIVAGKLDISVQKLLYDSVYYADGAHYHFLAVNGYGSQLISDTGIPGEALYVFFPAYPFLARMISMTGLDLRIAFVLLSNVFQIVSAFLLYRITDDKEAASRSVILFFMSVDSVFFGAAYTESMFIFLTLLAYILYREGKNAYFTGIIIGLSILTRNVGVFIYAAILAGMIIKHENIQRIIKMYIPATIIGLYYPVFCFIKSGSFIPFMSYQSLWYSTIRLPFSAVVTDLFHMLNGNMRTCIPSIISISAIFAGIISIYIAIKKREDIVIIIYMALSMILFVCLYKNTDKMAATSSVFRYVYAMFPVYAELGKIKNVTIREILYVLMPEMSIIVAYVFFNYSLGLFLA